jgi:hypothetical protein
LTKIPLRQKEKGISFSIFHFPLSSDNSLGNKGIAKVAAIIPFAGGEMFGRIEKSIGSKASNGKAE